MLSRSNRLCGARSHQKHSHFIAASLYRPRRRPETLERVCESKPLKPQTSTPLGPGIRGVEGGTHGWRSARSAACTVGLLDEVHVKRIQIQSLPDYTCPPAGRLPIIKACYSFGQGRRQQVPLGLLVRLRHGWTLWLASSVSQ